MLKCREEVSLADSVSLVLGYFLSTPQRSEGTLPPSPSPHRELLREKEKVVTYIQVISHHPLP